MVGLSVVFEAQKSGSSSTSSRSSCNSGGDGYSKKNQPQVINKTTLLLNNNKLSPGFVPAPTTFLDQCSLCYQKLLPGKDIYMYKGDKAFCSVECRCRQIFMDEEENLRKDHCSLAAMKPTSTSSSSSPSPSSSSSSSSSSSARHHRKGARRAGGFVY